MKKFIASILISLFMINPVFALQVPKGTEFQASLQSSVNSSAAQTGNTIAATLMDDLVYENKVIAKKGSIVYGEVVEAKAADSLLYNGKLVIKFDELLTHEGKKYKIETNKTVFTMKLDPNGAAEFIPMFILGALPGAIMQSVTVILVPFAVLSILMGDYKTFDYVLPYALAGVLIMPFNAAFGKSGHDIEVSAQTTIDIRLVKDLKVI